MSEIEKVSILCEEVYNPSEIFNLLKQTIKLETVEIYSISRTTQNLIELTRLGPLVTQCYKPPFFGHNWRQVNPWMSKRGDCRKIILPGKFRETKNFANSRNGKNFPEMSIL